ncbi:MAG: hypothetical protein COS94_07710 [Candidatus Hydrogenedentes bacterium CG07_land_8_20_14_0_80_42_17]|nr:MAG: hypothetical protein AUJ18_03495 [Candidatus Hydrogenedentes bacterium CG1_02_42_14]PIU47367.1 MAG: hypothetical protein COS94_07710 [Candidatus Hydrogenedentes bacterium CG07_land_8_20_14_0_80_42_17]
MNRTYAVVFSIVLTMLFSISSSAAPIGRPITAQNQWMVGGIVSYDKVDLENNQRTLRGEATSTVFLSEAAYGFADGAEFYLRLGTSSEKFRAGAFSPDLSSKLDWGVGIRGTWYDSYQNWKLVGDAQWMARPSRNYLGSDLDYTEWQVASAMEYRLTNEIFPYAGIFYQNLEITSNNQSQFPSVQAVNKVGAYLGAGFEPSPRWVFFTEARMSAGASVTAGANYRF